MSQRTIAIIWFVAGLIMMLSVVWMLHWMVGLFVTGMVVFFAGVLSYKESS